MILSTEITSKAWRMGSGEAEDEQAGKPSSLGLFLPKKVCAREAEAAFLDRWREVLEWDS
jgi:hypothetical protein